MPSERVRLLLDEDSPFLEICPLAGHELGSSPTGSASTFPNLFFFFDLRF